MRRRGAKPPSRGWAQAALVTGLVVAVALAPVRSRAAGVARERAAVAIIVHAGNRAPDPSSDELRAMLTLDRQFWPDGHRIVLFLPPPGSPEKDVLLEQVYALSDFELRKFWVGKLFRGAIPSIPSSLPTLDAVISAVRGSEGGMAAVLASEVPPGVRVLRIDGKAPGDPDYPLRITRQP